MITEHYRVDVIFEGARDYVDNFTPEDAETEYLYQIDDLNENCADNEWEVSIYNEDAEPPELVKTYKNEGLDD